MNLIGKYNAFCMVNKRYSKTCGMRSEWSVFESSRSAVVGRRVGSTVEAAVPPTQQPLRGLLPPTAPGRTLPVS